MKKIIDEVADFSLKNSKDYKPDVHPWREQKIAYSKFVKNSYILTSKDLTSHNVEVDKFNRLHRYRFDRIDRV